MTVPTTEELLGVLRGEVVNCEACAGRAMRQGASDTAKRYTDEAAIYREAIVRIERLELMESLL